MPGAPIGLDRTDEINKFGKSGNDTSALAFQNAKLFDRNFQTVNYNKHNQNVDRLVGERDFGMNDNASQGSDSDNFGEITGNSMKQDQINKGMPMRSQYNPRKPVHDANKYLDFNLFQEKPTKKTKVKSYDANDVVNTNLNGDTNNYSSFADIGTSMNLMSQQLNPTNVINNGVDRLGSKITGILLNSSVSKSNFTVCTFGLYSLFSSLYLISNENTELEIKKLFAFPKKNIVGESLHKIINTLNKIKDVIKIRNFFVFGNNIPYNPNALKAIEAFCMPAQVDISNPHNEAKKLSLIVNKSLGVNMRNPVVAANIDNLQIMLMTIAVIYPVWDTPFDKIAKGLFSNGHKELKQYYLASFGKVYPYFEDNDCQMLEVSSSNGKLMFGVLLNKKNTNYTDDDINKKISLYTEHLKPTTLDEVRIPAFSQDLKFRYNNIFKKFGLKTPFNGISSNVFSEGNPLLHDVISNVKIVIDNSYSKNSNTQRSKNMTINKFIANKPFVYYFRFAESSTILLNGYYYSSEQA